MWHQAKYMWVRNRCSPTFITSVIFRVSLIIAAVVIGFSFYHRNTNMWALKNLGDSFLSKNIGRRPIVIGAFHRPKEETNVRGDYAVIQFVGDARQSHQLYCHSEVDGVTTVSRAHIERIHKGKRAANDICAWSGHLAECELASSEVKNVKLSSNPYVKPELAIDVKIEEPLLFPQRQKLVVCAAPMYIYTEWQILITGIETWLALGATKIIVPVQSAANSTYAILKEYEKQGIVILRDWPMWPVLSDVNPNGLVLSRGIEESHVNCLFFAKPFSDIVVFTDIDDMLLPPNPLHVKPGINIKILEDLFKEHPQAGSFLFEHRDVQFVLPEDSGSENTLQNFNFNFLDNTKWKSSCKVWRMKTRVAVNASRVDSVNMHETGIHRFGHVQVRVPCRQAHFYHLRHSYKNIAAGEWPLEMSSLKVMLNEQWKQRLPTLGSLVQATIVKSSTESFEDFDTCMGSINEEHWKMQVSRCLTPHVCYSRLTRNISCVATSGNYAFVHDSGDYITVLQSSQTVDSEANCEAPVPKYIKGNHYYLP
uniref:Glycosyltransferase family 92 protein n=1 Tax=Panagrellus redivivus TaxID=6233 RepID=A0A7E4W0G8_PANRE